MPLETEIENKPGEKKTAATSTARSRKKPEIRVLQPGLSLGDYILREKIGQGSFGVVFEGHPKHSTRKVAIKIETHPDPKHAQLANEYGTYKALEGKPGFPRVEYFGTHSGHTFLVMEHLGMSLEDMLALRNRRFCSKTIFIIMKRMVELVEKLHGIGKVHRDLKPDNFLIGRAPKQLFLIDFGMAKTYMKHGQHIPQLTGKRLTGTPRYASVSAHLGMELGRRDDLESLGYILLYLAKGRLPWQGIKEAPKEKCRIIGEIKRHTNIAELVADMPGAEQAVGYFEYIRSMSFDQDPNYAYLKNLFDQALNSIGLFDDGVLEWEYIYKHPGTCAAEEATRRRPKKKGLWKRIRRGLSRCLTCARV